MIQNSELKRLLIRNVRHAELCAAEYRKNKGKISLREFNKKNLMQVRRDVTRFGRLFGYTTTIELKYIYEELRNNADSDENALIWLSLAEAWKKLWNRIQ